MNKILPFRLPIQLGLLTAVLSLLFFPSCKKGNDGPKIDQFAETNQWITDNMRIYYYWADALPADRRLNFNQEPDVFFETLRNPNDRFSWVDLVENLKSDLSGISTSTGMEFTLYAYGNDQVFAAIQYVIPGSPAEQKGVERGMLFTHVDGKQMTIDNFRSVLAPYSEGKGFTIKLATLSGLTISETSTEIALTTARVDEPSVHQHHIITTQSGKKVAYLFYNRFLNQKSNELFQAFSDFKAQGVQDIILDLRYNLGGGIASAGLLAALITPNLKSDNIFVKYQYNAMLNQAFDRDDPNGRDMSYLDLFEGLSDYPTANTADSIRNIVMNDRLNLPRLFVLATDNSASASELVINNLKPYMQVVHIGDTTIGKNEGSITIDPTNPNFNEKGLNIQWAVQPIVLKLADKNGYGDYHDGLVPTYEVNDEPPYAPLGSKEDPLIAKALSLIDPTMALSAHMRTVQPQATFRLIGAFDTKARRAKPVQVDGTMDVQKLKRAR